MDTIVIFQTLAHWAAPALAGGLLALVLLGVAYRLYRKKFRGTRTFTGTQAVCFGILCCWLILVICLTSLSRGANFSGWFNLDLFSGYISAWNNWSITELQLILFNMLMFAPLGFFLPLLWKKGEKLWVTGAVSLGVTGGIELLQLATGTGVFELDDLFHNLVGSLFGYFCCMLILDLYRNKRLRPAPLVWALSIPAVIAAVLGVVFWAYQNQPYGNMSILPAVKQDLSQIQVEETVFLTQEENTAAVYRNEHAQDKDYIKRVKEAFEQLEGLQFSSIPRRENENRVYTGTDERGNYFQINFFTRTGEWSYTTFADTAAPLTQEQAEQQRQRYETWMKVLGLLPQDAVFSVQNGDTLRWDVKPQQPLEQGTQPFQEGNIMIQFDPSGKVTHFYYQITWNQYAATEPILSQQEAYGQVLAGNFEQYLPFQQGDTLWVTQCQLVYLYDTKGYYQPAYEFGGYINDPENQWSCRIPALAQ